MFELTGETGGIGAAGFDTAFRAQLAPQPGDFDELGHVNNTVYVRWVQEIAVAHWLKMAPASLRAAAHFVVLRHEVDYRDPVLPGDVAEIRTWLGRAQGPRFDRHVDIRRAGATRFSARARTTWCMLNRKTGRPQRVGQEVFDAFGIDPAALE